MRVRGRAYFPFVFVVMAVVACVSGWARGQDGSAASGETKTDNLKPVAKPVRKADQETTTDPIALLAVHRGASAFGAQTPEVKADANTSADATARKAAEIAWVEQQIRVKQERITLLMRLFVEDERRFLNDPGNTAVDPAAAERRRYEQDELLWETAELAKLKARRTEMSAKR